MVHTSFITSFSWLYFSNAEGSLRCTKIQSGVLIIKRWAIPWPMMAINMTKLLIYMHCFTIPVLYSSKMILDYYHETSSKLLMEKIKFESILYLVSHFWIYQMSPSLKCIVPFVAKNQSYRSSTTFSRKLWLSYDNIMMTETSTKRCTAAGLESHFIRRTKYFSNWKFVWHSVSGS